MTTLTVTDHGDGTMTITLDPPAEFKGDEVAELVLKEPTARQVREAEKEYGAAATFASQTAYDLKLVGMVTGLTPKALDALPIGAVNEAAGFLQAFVEQDAADVADGGDPEPVQSEELLITIDPPLTFGGQSYAEIELREPLASEVRNARGHMRTAGSLSEARRAQMALVTAVSGLPAPVVEGLPIRLLNRAGRVLARFTTAGRKTGKR